MTRLVGRDIVCFSNDWKGDPLSKMHLMRLAARENRVLWINSLGNRAPKASRRDFERIWHKLRDTFEGVHEVEPNIFVLAPLALPIFGPEWVSAANRLLLERQIKSAMRQLNMASVVAWSFLPAAAPVFDRLGARLSVYHCVDEFSAFDGTPDAIAQMEREVMAQSDLVICSATKLQDSKRDFHPLVELVRHGVDHAHFATALDPSLETSPLVRDLPRPVLGFVGLMAEWVDQELLAALADHYAGGSVVIVGKEDVDTSLLAERRNVVRLGRQPYSELPSLLKGFDVALLPFVDNELTRAANPLKVREYLAAGLPVISTPVPEVEHLGLCHIAKDSEGFIAAIDEVMKSSPGTQPERSRAVESESWASKWEEISQLTGYLLAEIEGKHLWLS